ncbi:MAG: SCP2 sterol-binding domain-containing protein [Candidatus Obscuribacterales bacterium]|nr:SCP2 sterol-binding domain-containing protein [Candidatus Obscuribacterales bacterium]
MPFFNDSDELGTVMKELWVTIADDSKISSPLLDSKLIVRFHYKEPDGQITIDCSDGENMVIEWGDCVKQPVVEMFMQADVAHKFWMGQVNVPMYLLNGKMVAKGPVNKALALLPAIKPAFKKYPSVVRTTLNRDL